MLVGREDTACGIEWCSFSRLRASKLAWRCAKFRGMPSVPSKVLGLSHVRPPGPPLGAREFRARSSGWHRVRREGVRSKLSSGEEVLAPITQLPRAGQPSSRGCARLALGRVVALTTCPQGMMAGRGMCGCHVGQPLGMQRTLINPHQTGKGHSNRQAVGKRGGSKPLPNIPLRYYPTSHSH